MVFVHALIIPSQFCRVVTNVVSLFLPRFSHLTGSVVGLAGFALVLGTDKDNLVCYPSGKRASAFVPPALPIGSLSSIACTSVARDVAPLTRRIKKEICVCAHILYY
jgi:hypothetical protein